MGPGALSIHSLMDFGLFPLFGDGDNAALGIHLEGFVWGTFSFLSGVAFLGLVVVELNEIHLNKDEVCCGKGISHQLHLAETQWWGKMWESFTVKKRARGVRCPTRGWWPREAVGSYLEVGIQDDGLGSRLAFSSWSWVGSGGKNQGNGHLLRKSWPLGATVTRYGLVAREGSDFMQEA